MIDALAESFENRQSHHRHQLAQGRAGELLADHAGQHLRETFRGFQRDIADEAVADHDIGRALENIVALHVAVKTQAT